MKILYVGLLYNYGKQEEGYSYEHFNLEAGFCDCADHGLFEVDYWHPDSPNTCEVDGQLGNLYDVDLPGLLDNVDAVFHVAFNESLDLPESLAKLALKKDIPVIQWDCDSSWRFQNWILQRRDRVSHFVTTHSATLPWYDQFGMKAIRSQWGGSPLYVPSYIERDYDVMFCGQKHGQMADGSFVRAEIVDAIMNAGINLELFGNYWDGYENWHGYITHFEDILEAFNRSKVCLNLSNPWHVGTMPQIKGRHFEIPQIGRMQLCTPADDLESYFVDGTEIVIARTIDEMIERLRYYIDNEDEREAVAAAGHARILRDHQWSHRFHDIFSQIGLIDE